MSIQINNAKTFRYLFFVFLIVIALFFLSNIGFMLLRSVKYRKIAFENDKQLTELGLVRIEDNYRFEPYTHWMHQPYSSDAINIAESGYRNGWKSDDLSNTDTSETFSIYIFGGSTVWGEGVNDNETIPSWLARTLADRGFSDVNVHNLAVKAYCSTQEMIQFIILLRDGYRPDLVVFYDGVNDVFSPVLDGEPGSPIGLSNLRKIYNNAENTKSDRHEIRKWLSNVISLFTEAPFINWLRRKLINTDEPEAYDISDRNRIAKEVEAIYFNNVIFISKLCVNYDIQFCAFWQPCIFNKENLSTDETTIMQEMSEDDKKFYSRFKEIYTKSTRKVREHEELAVFQDLSEI